MTGRRVRSVSDAADLDTLGLRRYDVDPGQQLPLAYHVHERQEEAFFVIDGQLHVETPDGEFVVPAGSVFVAHPESPHRAFDPDEATDRVRVVAVGAPSVDDVREYDPDDGD